MQIVRAEKGRVWFSFESVNVGDEHVLEVQRSPDKFDGFAVLHHSFRFDQFVAGALGVFDSAFQCAGHFKAVKRLLKAVHY